MSFFKNLFRKKEQPQPEPLDFENVKIPASFVVIPNKLNVHVFQHTVHLRERQFEALAYVTEGMTHLKQQEMVLVICNKEQTCTFQEDPIHLFKGFYSLAEKGQIIGKGSTSYFDNKPLSGWTGILYTEMSHLPDQRFPANCLTLILVSTDELQMAKQMGHTRVLSLLGVANSFYPHPYWSDIDRNQLPVEQMMSKSLLSRMTTINLPIGSVTRVNRMLTLTLPHEIPNNYFSLTTMPPLHPVALLLGLNLEANGCLVWTWDGQPSAITPSDGDGSRMGGCILILFGQQPVSTIRLIEDGFGIGMTNEKWSELWESILHKKEFSLESTTDNMRFELVWK